MTTTVVEPTFVDTNVLVYSTDMSAPLHGIAIQKLAAFRQVGCLHIILLTSHALRI